MSAGLNLSKHNLKIGFLTYKEHERTGSWHGTAHFMQQALATEFLGLIPLELKRPANHFWRFANRLTSSSLGRSYNVAHSRSLANQYKLQIEAHLKAQPVDVLIAPAFSTAISRLNSEVPVIYVSDTTFELLYGYYDWFSNFWKYSEREGNQTESLAIRKSRFAVYASDWAARSAIDYYGAVPEHVAVIPFGANLRHPPGKREIGLRTRGTSCKLLFIGREWDRKGGDLVLNTFYQLEKMNFPVSLTLIGSAPPRLEDHPRIQVIPFLSKANPEDHAAFQQLMLQHHFLFVPSRAECFGIVFSEASAFGIPSITTDTGGIANAVQQGVNGYRLPLSAGPEDYAETICDIYQHFNERYGPLSISSRNLFESSLNWDQWATSLKPLILEAARRP